MPADLMKHFRFLNLFFAIEREFNIYIDRKEIIEHRLDKISDIKEIILKKC